jgi:hypothetical protein
MKKTIIALMALAGMAAADSITPITSNDFTVGRGRNQGNLITQNKEAGTLTLTGSNWNQAYAYYTLAEAITLSAETDTISISYNIAATNANTLVTGTIIGSGQAIVVGHGQYSGTPQGVQYGKTNNVSGNWYNLQGADTGGVYVAGTNVAGIFSTSAPLTLNTDIAWDADKAQFVATLSYGANKTVMTTYDLGTTYSLEKFVFSMDGPNNQTDTISVSGLNIAYSVAPAVPEPTTATLSLLALAGLTARRRRK